MMDFIMIAAGFALLFIGGEGLVRGAVAIAERAGLSKLIIGLTIVGFGTSAPELIVSVKAALSGAPSIALGNVVGSNIANVLLIIGAAALIHPIAGWRRTAMRDALVMTFSALVLFAMARTDILGRLEGGALLICLAVYLLASYWIELREREPTVFEKETEEFETARVRRLWMAALIAIISTAALMAGADLLVRGAVSIAGAFGVSDAVIGLTVVAIGTSLPELATGVVAALRKHPDVVLGNVIGSNIFNVLAILGVTATIRPVEVAPRFQAIDAPLMLVVMCLLVGLLFAARSIGRVAGAAMLALYTAYIVWLFANGAGA